MAKSTWALDDETFIVEGVGIMYLHVEQLCPYPLHNYNDRKPFSSHPVMASYLF